MWTSRRSLILPVLSLPLAACSAFIGPSGDPTERDPVQPDLLVRAKPGEAGDPVLETAVAVLLAPAIRPSP